MRTRTAVLLVLAGAVVTLPACSVTKVGTPIARDDPAAVTSTVPRPAPVELSTWGERYAWEDGLAVEIGTPVACQPGKFAFPQNIQRALKIPVVVINDTSESVDVFPMFTDAVQFDGRSAEKIMDGGGACGTPILPSTVLPGKTFTTSMAVAVGPAQGEMQVVVSPSFRHDKAVFLGPA